MNRTTYTKLRNQFTEKPTLGFAMLTLAAVILVAGTGVTLITTSEGLGFWVGQLLLGLAGFQFFSILHECGHNSFSPYRLFNVLVGHFSSLFCGLPFYSWKYIHHEHHKWAGNIDQDPTLQGLKQLKHGMNPAKKFLLEFFWRTWIPVISTNQQILVWRYGLRMKPLSHRRHCFYSSVWLAAMYVVVFSCWPFVLTPVHFLPALIVYLVVTELVNAPHHLAFRYQTGLANLPLWEQDSVTRSGYYPKGVSEFWFLNFNFHVEHHLFPHLPWHVLRKVRKAICLESDVEYNDTAGFGWAVAHRQRRFVELLAPLDPKKDDIKHSHTKRIGIRLMAKVVPFLPRFCRHEIYRRSIDLNYLTSPSLKIKVATTRAEYEAAFHLLYESYVKDGLMLENPWHLRVTKYHALPTTTVIIALWDNKIVGTLSIVKDNPLGLPMDTSFDLSHLRQQKKNRFAEISALAIDPNFRGQAGKIFFPLTKYMWEYASNYLHLEALIIAVHTKMADFYQAILLMEKITNKVLQDYAFANHNPAVGLILDFKKVEQKAYKLYCGRRKNLDLYRYYQTAHFPNFEYPHKGAYRDFDGANHPRLLAYFMKEKACLWATLTTKEKNLILRLKRKHDNILQHHQQHHHHHHHGRKHR